MPALEAYFPIKCDNGNAYLIFPEVLRSRSFLETHRIARDSDLEILSMRGVYTVASSVKHEAPLKEFTENSRKINPGLEYRDLRSAYNKIRQQIWELQHQIRVREILFWSIPLIRQLRLEPEEFQTRQKSSFLIRDYEISVPNYELREIVNDDDDYTIKVGQRPTEVLWPIKSGKINSTIKGMLGSIGRLEGRVSVDDNVVYSDGFRSVILEFQKDGSIDVDSTHDLKRTAPNIGVILGKRVRIPYEDSSF